ncbi:MAG: hypothetical protein AB7I32_14995 [Gammaproteobacteria bacterium]
MTITATPTLMRRLRELGRLVDMLTGESRSYSRHCEVAGEFRQSVRLKLAKLEQDMANGQLERNARAYPAEYASPLKKARAEIDALKAQLSESEAEEESIRARWAELSIFVASNSERLDQALAAIGRSRDELGIPWGDYSDARADVSIGGRET